MTTISQIDVLNLLQVFWIAQLLLLLSQAFVWLLETLQRDDATSYLQDLEEPLWLMVFCCTFAALIPIILPWFTDTSRLIIAGSAAAIWSLMFIIDLAAEWKISTKNVRALALIHTTINLTNITFCILIWQQL